MAAHVVVGTAILAGIGGSLYYGWRADVASEGDARKRTLHHFLHHGPRPEIAGLALPALHEPWNARREWYLNIKGADQRNIFTVEGEACSSCGYVEGRTATWRRYSSKEEYQKSSLLQGGGTTVRDVPIWVDTNILNTVMEEQEFYDAWLTEKN